MDEEYYNWIHFSEDEANTMAYEDFKVGDRVKLTRGPLRNRKVTLLFSFPDTSVWTCSLVIDGVEMEFDIEESFLEPVDNA